MTVTFAELLKVFSNDLKQESISSFLEANIISTPNLTAEQHFRIYQHSVYGILQQTLMEIYAVCLQLVGQDFFINMIAGYIQRYSSTTPNLANYGEFFAEWVHEYIPAQCLPYLPDVVKLEWTWHKLFDAENNPEFNYQKLEECYVKEGDNIIFLLPKYHLLMSSIYPIHQIVAVNQKNYQGDKTIILEDNHIYYYLVWRNKLERTIEVLTYPQWQFLTCIQQGFSLGEINEITTNFPGMDVVELLPECVQRGWLIDFVLKPSPSQ